jgi:hypothetical protein
VLQHIILFLKFHSTSLHNLLTNPSNLFFSTTFQPPVVNEIMPALPQASYSAYQPQPTVALTNRSGFFIKYDLKEEIGLGSTSKCYKCTRKSDGQEFACKVIDKRQVEVKFSGLLDQFFVEIKVRLGCDSDRTLSTLNLRSMSTFCLFLI